MAATNHAAAHTARIADRLVVARRERFVGRESELALFRSALVAAEAPFAVLYLYGPGGIGKTTLLREYARTAATLGRRVVHLDGREVDPTPSGFLLAVGQSLGVNDVACSAIAAHWPSTGVLLIDRYELLSALDPWLREQFLPELPARSLAVIASRNPPNSAWRTDIDWAELTQIVPLRDLSPEDSEAYLTARGIPAEQHAHVLAFTHGHPLALTLVADVLNRGGGLAPVEAQLEPEPDVVHVLLERLVQDVPSAAHRQALDICVRMWATTEALLGDMLEGADAHELFEWLRQLSFIEHGPYGLFPHDLAREVLDADWRWRNPEHYRQLTQRLFGYLFAKFEQAQGREQQRVWFYLLYLCRHSPIYRPYYEWTALGSAYAELATIEDHAAIVAMVRRHEGEASARIVEYWLRRQPEAFRVFRYVGGDVFGFLADLVLREATAEDMAADPAIRAALDFVKCHGPLRQGEEILYSRYFVNQDTYQQVSPALNLAAINVSIDLTTHPKLAWNFITFADPAMIEPHFTAAHFWRSPEADFEVGGHRYGVFAHDWRAEPPRAWINVKAALASDPYLDTQRPNRSVPPALLVLSQQEFGTAVRQALRDYLRPDVLATNPLMSSRLIAHAADLAGNAPSPAALQALMLQAVADLATNPKDAKLHRAIWHTYIEPAPTQERAAEQLGLPFNTYRYHLANGIERIAAWLWQRELRGASS